MTITQQIRWLELLASLAGNKKVKKKYQECISSLILYEECNRLFPHYYIKTKKELIKPDFAPKEI